MEICKSILEIGDDFGDNVATMRCKLSEGHEGRHREVFFRDRAAVEWDDKADQANFEDEGG